jgi:hypothetical protein
MEEREDDREEKYNLRASIISSSQSASSYGIEHAL